MSCESCGNPNAGNPCKTCATATAQSIERKKVNGTMKVMYMERDNFVGERKMDTAGITVSEVPYTASYPNTAYFCPVCGELWGRSIYTAINFTYRPYVTDSSWVVETRRCVRHGDGTFLTSLPLDACDKELLTRELLALLERNQNGNE